eukprot:m.913291 g.913291  ORF g.913291 m.913291 type:complete len:1084 (-) comp60127_c0_seq10:265-3516(-)
MYSAAGVLNGMSSSNWARGVGDSGFGLAFNQFGQTGQSVTLTANASAPVLTANLTLSLWAFPMAGAAVMPQSTTPVQVTALPLAVSSTTGAQIGQAGSAGVSVAETTSGIMVLEYLTASTACITLSWTAPAPLMAWTYLTVVYTNGLPALYVNGALVATGLQSPNTVQFVPASLGTAFVGYLDDVYVYNTTVAAIVATGLYTFEQSQSISNTYAYFPFGEGTGLTVYDSSGMFNGTLKGMTATNWVRGQSGSALSFAGQASVQVSSTITLSQNFAVSFWMLPSATQEIDQEALSGYSGNSGQRFVTSSNSSNVSSSATAAPLSIAAGTNCIAIYQASQSSFSPILVWTGTLTTWTLVTVISTNNVVTLYVNGVFARSALTSNFTITLPVDYIGGSAYGYFSGTLDEVRFYNYSLTPSVVQALYNYYLVSDSYSHYGFDEVSGILADDDGAANADGVMQAMDDTNRVPGVYNGALLFNADRQNVAITTPYPLQDNFTVCFWAKPTANHSISGEFNRSSAALTGKRYAIQPLDGCAISITALGVGVSVGSNGVSVIETGFNNSAVILEWLSPSNLSSVWSHICVSFSSGTPTLYINAVPVRQGLKSVGPSFLQVASVGGTTQYYRGYIDELRVFTARLTQIGVSQLYQSDLYRAPRNLWHFDEGLGNVTLNSQTNLNASINNAQIANWINGIIGGGALHFDLWNTTVAIPAPTQVASTDFTVNLWVRPYGTVQVYNQSSASIGQFQGQRFVIAPNPSANVSNSFGLSVGSNAVVVFAQSATAVVPLLVWQGALGNWTFLSVVFSQNQPRLYVNGLLAQVGVVSLSPVSAYITTLGCLPSLTQCYFGDLDELSVYFRPMALSEVLLTYNNYQLLANNLIAYWPFDEGSGPNVADLSSFNQNGLIVTPANSTWIKGRVANAIYFDASLSPPIFVQLPNFKTSLKSNFTFAMWVNPAAAQQVDPQSTTGIWGNIGQRYAIDPVLGNSLPIANAAGVGVSVGTNGISVYEHAANYMPAILVSSFSISTWTHVANVHQQSAPALRQWCREQAWCPEHSRQHAAAHLPGLVSQIHRMLQKCKLNSQPQRQH